MPESTKQRISIAVVRHEGELLFEVDGVWFDLLEAFQEFEGGSLTVMRNGRVFDHTSNIVEYGTHAACTCFIGLDKSVRALAASALNPGDFQEGDALVLEVSATRPLKLVDLLRAYLGFTIATDEAFTAKGGSMTLGELSTQLAARRRKAAERVRNMTVLRFCRKR